MIGAYPGSFDPPTVAHLAIAETAVQSLSLERVDFVVSRQALGKIDAHAVRLADRLVVLAALAESRPWLHIVVTDQQLLVDVAAGYDVLVLGADKWAQVIDPAWYGGSVAARDDAVARLPRVALAARPPFEVPGDHPVDRLPLEEALAAISSSAVRSGRWEWMAPEAAQFAARTGAWIDPDRYAEWVARTEA